VHSFVSVGVTAAPQYTAGGGFLGIKRFSRRMNAQRLLKSVFASATAWVSAKGLAAALV